MWILYAMGASMFWGLMYILGEQLYKRLSITTTIALTCGATAIAMLLIALIRGDFKKDMGEIFSSRDLSILLVAEIITFFLAELFIASSITSKNATLAGLIEISYPIFIAFFAYVLFKENTVNTSVIAGAFLIFSGIFVIYRYNY